ncbi:DUF1311 domain-containing protein [Stakelama sp. CBK3Z-3]|uniref:DUF1311 domain-containing protein n=1 Tax=Stakelama flava TaxID=2860338 RepID=A0ABS6XI53_9SPHN|nr:lysozyme inhibitor LprI family protein [Stakelama flava]MBW4329861.1 DUF1311 domain-containing protein [Stakelama flava]
MLLLPLLMVAAAPAASEDCIQAATTNADFAKCGAAQVKQADAALNAMWKKVYPGLDTKTKAALLEEQRLWVRFKDKSCQAWSTGYFGREGQVIHFYTCRATVIRDRTAYLESLLGPQ